MPLNRPSFDVYLNGTGPEPSEHRVTITHQDQLRAEQQLAALGVDPRKRALLMTTAWAWAALCREEVYTAPFKRFSDTDCAGVETPADGVVSEDVDPTQLAGDTDSPSPSPASGPEQHPTTG